MTQPFFVPFDQTRRRTVNDQEGLKDALAAQHARQVGHQLRLRSIQGLPVDDQDFSGLESVLAHKGSPGSGL